MTTIEVDGWLQLRALLLKEWRVQRRGSLPLLVAAVPYGAFLEWFVVRNAARTPSTGHEGLGFIAAATLAILPALLIPFIAGNAIARALADDRARQSLVPLFATGVPPWICWLARVTVAFALGYGAALASLSLDVVLLRWSFGVAVPLTWRLAALALAVVPALALGLVALVATVQWAAPRLAPAATLVPFLALMLAFSRMAEHPPATLPAGALAAVAVGALLTVAACGAVMAWAGHGRLAGT